MGFVNWDSESYPSANDFLVVPKIAKRLIFGKKYASSDVKIYANRKKIEKFKESAWKFVYFLSAELFALSVSYSEPWFTNTKYFWVGPGDQIWPDQKLKLKLKGLYMYGAGFYTYSIFALLFWETRRSDFLISMGHHVTTVALLVLSYIFRFARVGSIILALHDATDVYLEIAKMSRYSGYEWISSIFFVAFVISWTILRVIYFPFWILWSTSYEVLLTLDLEKHNVDGPLHYYIFNTLLFCVVVFNIYWWMLMVGMVLEQIRARGQVPDDVRSDSEGEDKHND
ncbi:ceramide synthase 1 LOH3-like isoform X2 [Euphorbia lathyris]|uniref:ceramide synthase 1 LOH3-like isoform X2 n=1 Tax=Euphorbia lathyris TaxID=212925 RepID=UPI0033132CA1